ncbi:MAG: chemotaxis protein CheW [Candidatus Marinimicrobia bacterium]|nr:chemotaxis protein CheW [Candidatus Neomarinimicrobiota bacterium]MCF7841059.1 chemotaxis protein CheW [Candidatus Neomarinimicrobiota bacterium]
MSGDSIISSTRSDLQRTQETGQLQLVCFRLDEEDFGVDIHHVQEINRRVKVTKIPQSAAFVEGVINLRGKIVPVIDLRRRFGFPPATEQTKESRIVVVETQDVTVGMVVDEVTEVLRLSSESIKPTPEIALSEVENQYIKGVTNSPVQKDDVTGKSEHLLIVLDMDRIFTQQETRALRRVADEAGAAAQD